MKGALFLASCLLLAVSSPLATSTATSELALEHDDHWLVGGRTHEIADADAIEHLMTRRLASMMTEAKTEKEQRDQAKVLFKLYKAINPKEVAKWGETEEEQFDVFFKTVFKKLLAKINKGSNNNSNSNGGSSTNSPSTNDGSGSGKYSNPKTSDKTEVGDSLSFFTEVYDEDLAKDVRALQDNTKNIEAIVQSTKTGEKNEPANEFQSPTVLEGLDDDEDGSGNGRRLAEDGTKPVQVLFCDVSGNAIWKWDNPAAKNDAPIKTNTSISIQQPAKLCESTKVTVKVTAYQSGCSRQNHPEGCDNVYYKGCGGLTVNRASNRVVVARTGGRSLGLLYYKSLGDTCQGRVVDAITTFRGKKFNSPTYAEYNTKGDLYFTDSPFGLAKSPADFEGDTLDKSPLRELPFNGVYVLKNNATRVELVDCFMDRPNKIAFSPKQDKMYVTNSRKGNSYVKEFELKEDGTIGKSKIFFNFDEHPELETAEGYADGIKVDSEGLIYVAAHKGIFIFTPDATLIGTVRSNQQLSGLALGGGRMFLSGSFGVVAQSTGVSPSLGLPSAKTDCK